jgi:hypothetical protein
MRVSKEATTGTKRPKGKPSEPPVRAAEELELPERWSAPRKTELVLRLLRGEEHRARAREERAAVDHWITSSARPSSDGGMVRPSALAVLRLMTSSNFVGCSTGRSAGLAPFRILST